ncbi:tripartite motif-containing protein 16-like [Triplophysa rosa]|uniref:tripartite motif-containing protein 16-like n=1 Tax=Triplophysa rosa TaxID=992332 RepID=UPI002545E52E|nr:tripartite motif-containing protein 16-like [Triplophysa rosa]XP_057207241.1 tripartite motif-containing protein 16-like [Triplophysa rosa]
MAESEHHEQFVCSICLDALKEPVTIPCGHSYCLMCINDCWGQKEQRPPYRCPQCRESFTQRPLLKKNTLLSEMMVKLEKTSLHTASCSQENSCVECDVCTTEKNRAVMSCLQCLASFCECHLQPHYQSPVFMKHKLVKATTQVQENVCVHHGKLMEIYCQDDNQCICYLCMIDFHKGHSVVSVESEWTKKKKALQKTKVTCTKMIQDLERGQQELGEVVKTFKSSAQEAMENSEKVFTELIHFLEKKCSEVKERISAQEKAEMYRAEYLNRQLGQELADLRQRDTEISKLLNTDDQVHFLKSFQSVCDVPIVLDLVSITQHTHLSFKDISIPTMKKALEDVCMQETDKISQEVSNVHIVHLSQPNIRSEFLKYFCGLHLDPNTVNSDLILSDGNVTVSNIYMTVAYPDHPERFDVYGYVMCREGLRGRCYWEVECRGDNWSVAVSYKGIGRKGAGHDCRLGFNKKSWRLGYDGQNFCFVHNKAQVHVPAASRIGVYLDHRAGILAFYKISDTMTLIHRVLTTFTEPLYPAFGIAAGSSVTISGKERIQKDL